MKKTSKILYTGSDERPYCAFPTLIETQEGILLAWKQGISHLGDEGITSYLLMDKDGTIRSKGTAAAVPEFNTQNAELLAMPDGSIRCYLDIQDYRNHKKRTGVIVYEYRNGSFERIPGILTDTDSKQYGYVFDGAEWNGKYLMLAMTFPELDYPNPQKTVEILSSADNGTAWTDTVCLDELLDAPLNESTLAVLGDKLYVLCRSYQKEMYLAVLDSSMKMVKSAVYGEQDGIFSIGRPKLFIKDGSLYGIIRNHHTADSPMELILVKIHPETLRMEKTVVLDDTQPKDGYYAEHYFDGDSFCVVTYKTTETDKPDLVLLTFDWNELV